LAVDRIVVIGAPSSGPDVLREFRELIALPPRAMTPMVRALEQRGGAPMESFDVETFVGRIDASLLVVHDTDDAEVPYVNGMRLSELFDAPLMTTSGLGHRRILFAPDVVTAVVEFVATADLRNSDRRCVAPKGGAITTSRSLPSHSNPALERS